MSVGEPWIDLVMEPLRGQPAHIYNRIYEAVGRGSEVQGRALVKAIIEYGAAPQTQETYEGRLRREGKDVGDPRNYGVAHPDDEDGAP